MIFTHIKTGNMYEVIDSDAKLEWSLDPVVVYKSVETGKTWVRPKQEFFERFEPTRTVKDIFDKMRTHEDELKRLKGDVERFRAECKHYWQDDSGELWTGKYCKICGTST